jgi:hypothetical protein
MRKPTLHFRRVPREKGLAAICQGERGYYLFYGDEKVATVAVYQLFSTYYWYARHDELGIPLKNTCVNGDLYASIDDAKAACRAYVNQCLVRM